MKIRNNKFLSVISTILIAVFAVMYIRNQSVNLLSAPLDYDVAYAVSGEQSVEAECIIIRNETVLTSPYAGVILPAVDDGKRVAKGKEAVRVYSNSNDIETENRIRAINKQIDVLENSKINTATVETKPDRIDDEIDLLVEEAVVSVSKNDLSGALAVKDDLLIEMNKRWQYSATDADFQKKIDSLNAAKNSLRASLGNVGYVITTPVAGYYYSDVDGYETLFSSEKIAGLSLDTFNEMLNTAPIEYTGNICGKLVTDHLWYAVCKMPTEYAYYFDVGKSYDVDFTFSDSAVISMELMSKIEENGKNEAVLVFVSSVLPDDFEYIRKQQIRLVYKSYSGLRIPKEAVRVVNGVKGVYVSGGTSVRFKLIREIHSVDDYYIVDMNKDNYPLVEKNKEITEDGIEKITYYPVVSLYDRVITENKDIYDGMDLR